MKIAVCISGQQRMNPWADRSEMDDNLLYAFRNVDVDIFRHTWDNSVIYAYEDLIIEPEPEIHYHPVLDTTEFAGEYFQTKRNNGGPSLKLFQGTKQILAHNTLVSRLDKEYDLIVRCRWDVYFSRELDYNRWFEKSYNEGPIGMGYWDWNQKVLNNPTPHLGEQNKNNVRWYKMISPEAMIMHRPEYWDCKRVNDLHESGNLLPAEWGWYQVLVNGREDHKGYLGGVLTLSQTGGRKK